MVKIKVRSKKSNKTLEEQREEFIKDLSTVLLSKYKGYHEIKVTRELYVALTMGELHKIGDYVNNFIKLVYSRDVNNYEFIFDEYCILVHFKENKNE